MTTQLELITGEPARRQRVGRLDDHTLEVGRLGLSQARAALREASMRAAARDEMRAAARDNELAERAREARLRTTGRGNATATGHAADVAPAVPPSGSRSHAA